VGVGVLALASIVVAGTLMIPVSPIYARVGPKLFPWIAGGGLVVLGAALVLVGLRGGWSAWLEDRPTDPFNPVAFGLLLAGLVANAALIDHVGFVLAATVQFMLVCACFGSRAHLRNAGVGFAICLGAYLLFARALGVNIGAGIVEGLVDRVL
jgi:putative tricarboxylic transport membrane protein